MALLVADCPRCGAKQITFDVKAQALVLIQYDWQPWYEIFCVCRACHHPTIFLVSLEDLRSKDTFVRPDGLVNFAGTLNGYFKVNRFISIRDNAPTKPPEHLPEDIQEAFTEGAACLSIGCNNAAATMFRLCVDLVTRPLLPDPEEKSKSQPSSKQRRDLGLRLPWLFDNEILPSDLRELASCIKEDGNDGAHAGNLTKVDAEDLLDFTFELLERLITEPKKIELAKERRKARREPQELRKSTSDKM